MVLVNVFTNSTDIPCSKPLLADRLGAKFDTVDLSTLRLAKHMSAGGRTGVTSEFRHVANVSNHVCCRQFVLLVQLYPFQNYKA